MTRRPGEVRRIVVVDEDGRSRALSDGPAPDVRTDPARPGFAATRLWVTDQAPLVLDGLRELPPVPDSLEPPSNGSVLRVVTFPPDDTFIGTVGEGDVRSYFQAMGSPEASTFAPGGRHPYMQRTQTLDFCLVLEGEITLVLDTQEVHLRAGDTVVQRGTNHAWSNRSGRPCTVAISSHDARR